MNVIPIRIDGMLPFHLAVHRGHMKTAKLLIENDLDTLRADIFWYLWISFLIMGYICLAFISASFIFVGPCIIYDYKFYNSKCENIIKSSLTRAFLGIDEDISLLALFLFTTFAWFIDGIICGLIVVAIIPIIIQLIVFCVDVWFSIKQSPILNY